MSIVLLVIVVWAAAASGCLIMRKISPESATVYMIYAITIALLFSLAAGLASAQG